MNPNHKRLITVSGLLLSVFAFYLKSGASFPFVQAVVAPHYAAAKRAIEHLEHDLEIKEGQRDFSDLAGVVEEEASAKNPTIPRGKIHLEKMALIGSAVTFGPISATPVSRVMLTFRGQSQAVEYNLNLIKPKVEALWDARSLRWSLLLFWTGMVLTLLPIALEMRASRREGKITVSRSHGDD